MNYSSILNRENENKVPSGEWKAISPANLDLALGTCQYRYSDVDLAMKGGADILPPPEFSDRIGNVQELHRHLISKKELILSIARAELARTEAEFELEWDLIESFLKEIRGERLKLPSSYPRGLTVLLGSYVWPMYYTIQFTVMNFLAGNALIVKPAEKSTLTALKLVEVFREIPAFQSVQAVIGDREVGRRVATHEAVSTILFQGSFEVGMRVKQDALSMPGKEVLLYLGAKNPAIVFADAAQNTEEILLNDAFLSAGQDCRSISVIFVEHVRLAEFVKKFHELSKAFKIGGPGTSAFMGPLIDGPMLDRYLKFIGISEREGAEVIMRGKPLHTNPKGHFVTPSIALFETLTADQMRKSVSLQTEILSPHVSIVGFKDEAEMISLFSMMTHGKLATLWTENPSRADRVAKQLSVGEVMVNGSAHLKNPMQTTQARKRSGNHAFLGEGLLDQLVFRKQVSG